MPGNWTLLSFYCELIDGGINYCRPPTNHFISNMLMMRSMNCRQYTSRHLNKNIPDLTPLTCWVVNFNTFGASDQRFMTIISAARTNFLIIVQLMSKQNLVFPYFHLCTIRRSLKIAINKLNLFPDSPSGRKFSYWLNNFVYMEKSLNIKTDFLCHPPPKKTLRVCVCVCERFVRD